MQNLPATYSPSGVPALPAALMDQLAASLGAAMNSFAGGGKFIKFSGKVFSTSDGGTLMDATGHPRRQLQFVILNLAQDRHCLWYENAYNPKAGANNDSPPTAVWWLSDNNPAGVPDWVLTEKKKTDYGEDARLYQIRQRLVVALMEPVPGGMNVDMENIYCMDISGSSIYGPSQGGALNFKDLAKRVLGSGWVFPTFPVSAAFTGDNVPILRFGLPLTPQGQMVFFDGALAERLCTLALSAEVKALLDPVAAHQSQAPASPAQTPAPAPAPPPQTPVYTAPPPAAPAYEPPTQAQAPALPKQPDAQAVAAAKRRGKAQLQPATPAQAPAPAAPAFDFGGAPTPTPTPASAPATDEIVDIDQAMAVFEQLDAVGATR